MVMTKTERTVYDRAVMLSNKYQKKLELIQKQVQDCIGYFNTVSDLRGTDTVSIAEVKQILRNLKRICEDM